MFADFGIEIYAEMVGVEGKRFFSLKLKQLLRGLCMWHNTKRQSSMGHRWFAQKRCVYQLRVYCTVN